MVFVSINTGLNDHFCYSQMHFGGPVAFRSGERDDGEGKEEFLFSLPSPTLFSPGENNMRTKILKLTSGH